MEQEDLINRLLDDLKNKKNKLTNTPLNYLITDSNNLFIIIGFFDDILKSYDLASITVKLIEELIIDIENNKELLIAKLNEYQVLDNEKMDFNNKLSMYSRIKSEFDTLHVDWRAF